MGAGDQSSDAGDRWVYYTTSTGAEVVQKEIKKLEKKGLDLTAATRLSDLLDRIAEGRALPGDVKTVKGPIRGSGRPACRAVGHLQAPLRAPREHTGTAGAAHDREEVPQAPAAGDRRCVVPAGRLASPRGRRVGIGCNRYRLWAILDDAAPRQGSPCLTTC